MEAELIFACLLSLSGIGAALLLVARLSLADRNLRNLRLSAFDLRLRENTRRLNALLVAENAKLIAKGIDQGSILLQGGHRALADVTLGILQLFPATREHARIVRDTHNLISDGLYGVFREVNRQIGGSIAENLKNAKPQPKRKADARKRGRVKARIKKKKP